MWVVCVQYSDKDVNVECMISPDSLEVKHLSRPQWEAFVFDVFLLQSIFNMIPVDDQKNLPEDENSPEKRAEKIWTFFGKKENGNPQLVQASGVESTVSSPLPCPYLLPDKISEGEFIRGVMDNKDILRLIQYDEPQKIKDKLKEKRQ